jgi:hypothetical protein
MPLGGVVYFNILSNINNGLCNFLHIFVGPIAQHSRPSAGFQQTKGKEKAGQKPCSRILIRTLKFRAFI